MAIEVTVPAAMSYDGIEHRWNDTSEPMHGIDEGEHVNTFIPIVKDVVSVAAYVVSEVDAALVAASSEAINAAASADAALASENAAADSVAKINTLGLATGLQTTGAGVVVSAATPPTTGQVLQATSPTTATWQTLMPTPDFLIMAQGVI